MMLRSATASLALLLAPCLVWMAFGGSAEAGILHHCQKTVFVKPRPPHVKYKCVCPKKICPCCPLENFGYYPTCWHPWPFPPNYGHCPVPPAAAMAPMIVPGGQTPLEQLPQPKMVPAPSQPSLQ